MYFAEAMSLGHMEPYFPLIEQFVTQEEPTFCGLGTLTMVMNALRVDPRRRWHDDVGPGWRWWSDEMFPTSCTGSLERIRMTGVTMEEFRNLAAANGGSVQMRRPTDAGESMDSFRSAIVEAASNSSHSSFLVSSFDRASLGQTGALLSSSLTSVPCVTLPQCPVCRVLCVSLQPARAFGMAAAEGPPSARAHLTDLTDVGRPHMHPWQVGATSRPSAATMLLRMLHSYWTSLASSTRHIGCR